MTHPMVPRFTEAQAREGLARLESALQRDFEILQYPKREWVKPRTASDGRAVLDVLVVGGGQSGLVACFALMRERVTNVLVIDENPQGREGPWRTFARMKTLRTPKHLTGPDLGIPNLSIQAWWEAQHGEGSWAAMGLVPKETWADYLAWYRRVLRLPVRNETRAGAIEWMEGERCFRVPLHSPAGESEVLARKVVLATGIDGSGRWVVPSGVEESLPKNLYAHTREDIDFEALRGKRVGVFGAGASAFDNASVALETGAAEVHLFLRRHDIVRVNPYRWAEFAGFLHHHADMPDALKWSFINQILRMGQLPPADTWARASQHPNFRMHPGTSIHGFSLEDAHFVMHTSGGDHRLDYLIVGTGFATDLSLRPELENFHEHIALWKDHYTPPTEETNVDLSHHPYLGPHFEFVEKVPGTAPWLSSIFNYTFGCLPSLGFGGASISGMKYSIPRLVAGITAQLYAEDAAEFLDSLRGYDVREF